MKKPPHCAVTAAFFVRKAHRRDQLMFCFWMLVLDSTPAGNMRSMA